MRPQRPAFHPKHPLARQLAELVQKDAKLLAVILVNPPDRAAAWILPRLPDILLKGIDAGAADFLRILNVPSCHKALSEEVVAMLRARAVDPPNFVEGGA
jgi:hypothetical protein